MSIFRNHLPIMGASGQSTGYEIDQSIRFNSANSAYMHRTPSSSGNRKKFTSSFWVKFGDLTDCALPMPSVAQNASYGAYLSSGVIQFFIYYTGSAWQGQLYTNRVFRDASAWYHFVIAVDTTQAVSTERVRIYINGLRETSFSTENYPNQNQDTDWNNSGEKIGIGVNANGFSGSFGEYYAAEMHYLDGYAYGPEYFGEFKEDTDIWIPKKYSGSYGTNGFKIDGRDSGDLGDDESGNGNDFTTVGLVATDQRTDSPTNNHATFNPLINATPAFANGNIEVAFQPASSTKWAKTVMNFTLPNTGTWYWEGQEFNNVIYPATAVGIVDSDVERLDDKDVSNRFTSPMGTFTGLTVYSGPGQSIATYTYKNGVETSTSATAILSTSRLGFLWEPENNRFTIYDDGSQHTQFTSINAGNYVFGVNQATGTNLYFRLFVEANDWTETPTGITSANALNTKNIGS